MAHSGYVCAMALLFHKFSGASGSVRAERYFREGMLALPYHFLEFSGAWREGLCEYAANGSHNLVAQAVLFVQNGTLGRASMPSPTIFLNLVARGG